MGEKKKKGAVTKNVFLTGSLCWIGAAWCTGTMLVANWCPVLSLVVRAVVSGFLASSSSQQLRLSLCLEHLHYPKPPHCVGSSSHFLGLNKQSDEGWLEMVLFQGARRALQAWELGNGERMRWGCRSLLEHSNPCLHCARRWYFDSDEALLNGWSFS